MSPADAIRYGWENRRLLGEEHIVHAVVVVIVVIAAAVLRGMGRLDNNTVSIVFGTAIGYAAGRSGGGPRATRAPARRADA